MPKANLALIAPPEQSKPFTVEIATDWHPDGKYVFALSRLTAMRLIVAQGRADELYNALESGADVIPPVGDEPVIVSRDACVFAMMIDLAQRSPVTECYSAKDVLRMMCEDKVLEQLTEIRDQILPSEPHKQDAQSPLAPSPDSGEE